MLYFKLELNIKYWRSTDKYFQEPVAFWNCQSMPICLEKRSLCSFWLGVFRNSSFSYCWWRQSTGRDCLSFDRVYTSICTFTRIIENQQLHCFQYHLLKISCFPHWHCIFFFFCFLGEVKILCISKKLNQL